jgi:AcrR family transcriptional regulator
VGLVTKREQLLDAAETVLLRRGLRATTVADVADVAGVAKGTTYLYFSSKDDVLAALRARYLERFTEALIADADAPAGERLDAFVEGLFRFAAEHQDLHHALFHEAGFSEADAFTGARAVLEEILSRGVARGELVVDDVRLAASFLLHGLHGVLVHTMHAAPPAQRRRRSSIPTDAVAALVHRAVICGRARAAAKSD